jgi:branched-chain amino acid transport system substrate-binding protein
MARNDGAPPNSIQAGVYSAVTHYLRAIEAAGTDDADRVGRQMRKMKINDFMTKNAWIREDGGIMRDMVLQQVKSPGKSRYPFDYFKTLAKIPAEAAFRPLEEGGCPHAKKS